MASKQGIRRSSRRFDENTQGYDALNSFRSRSIGELVKLLQQVLSILTPRMRRRLPWLILIFAISSIFEVAGVTAIFPFMMIVANPDLIETNRFLHAVHVTAGSPTPQSFVLLVGVAVLATLAIGNLAGATTTWLSLKFVAQERADLSAILLERYLSHRYLWFLNRNTAELSRNVSEEVSSIPFGVLLPLLRIFSRFLVVCLVILQLILLNPMIAIGTTVILGGAYSIVWLNTRNHLNRLGTQRLATEIYKVKVGMEALNGIKICMVLGREESFLGRFHRAASTAAQIQARHGLLNEVPRYLLETLAFGGVIVVVLVLSAKGGDVGLVLPTISVFTLGAYRLMPALQQSSLYLGSIRGNLAALEYLGDEFHLDPKECRNLQRAEPLRLQQQFSLTDIRFTYPDSPKPVLDGITLSVKQNSTIALVGTTGSGKTTLVDVILGLLRPQEGTIDVDGQVLDDTRLRAWQANIGYVSQDVYLIDESIAANIAFGVPEEEVDQQAVESAAKIANLHDFIVHELPRGYSTVVGDRGVRLSGGQRQRVGIARAVYTNPQILILDEATSSLDGITENIVMEAVQSLASQKTIIMIAHRFSTIQACDQIYLLEHGRITDHGSYAQLMENNSTFRSMAQNARQDNL